MLVECIMNDLRYIENEKVRNRLSQSIHRDGPNDILNIGIEYSVCAITNWFDKGIFIYLHVIDKIEYPYPFPLEFFKIKDASVPDNWVAGTFSLPGSGSFFQIGFPEWAQDMYFYEKLVDGDLSARSAYARNSVLM